MQTSTHTTHTTHTTHHPHHPHHTTHAATNANQNVPTHTQTHHTRQRNNCPDHTHPTKFHKHKRPALTLLTYTTHMFQTDTTSRVHSQKAYLWSPWMLGAKWLAESQQQRLPTSVPGGPSPSPASPLLGQVHPCEVCFSHAAELF